MYVCVFKAYIWPIDFHMCKGMQVNCDCILFSMDFQGFVLVQIFYTRSYSKTVMPSAQKICLIMPHYMGDCGVIIPIKRH